MNNNRKHNNKFKCVTKKHSNTLYAILNKVNYKNSDFLIINRLLSDIYYLVRTNTFNLVIN